MSTEVTAAVLVAILAAAGNLVSVYKLIDRVRSLEQELAAIRVRTTTLWEIYAEDAIRDARNASLARQNSPVRITPQWKEIVPAALRNQIGREIVSMTPQTGDAYETAIEVFFNHKDELKRIAKEADVRLSALFGVIYYMSKKYFQSRVNKS